MKRLLTGVSLSTELFKEYTNGVLDMKSIDDIKRETIGDVFTFDEFCDLVYKNETITENDGYGYMHNGEKETDIYVFDLLDELEQAPDWKIASQNYKEKYPFVIWYEE